MGHTDKKIFKKNNIFSFLSPRYAHKQSRSIFYDETFDQLFLYLRNKFSSKGSIPILSLSVLAHLHTLFTTFGSFIYLDQMF